MFRSTIETVAVPTTVFDRAGNLVTNLTLDDFKVFDDGYRQAVDELHQRPPADSRQWSWWTRAPA